MLINALLLLLLLQHPGIDSNVSLVEIEKRSCLLCSYLAYIYWKYHWKTFIPLHLSADGKEDREFFPQEDNVDKLDLHAMTSLKHAKCVCEWTSVLTYYIMNYETYYFLVVLRLFIIFV